uniref:Ig-like domain-containing protein n=1 Tax=Scleropages formosus TaxID=113540 RepID=A0A8C9V002_SCLFO
SSEQQMCLGCVTVSQIPQESLEPNGSEITLTCQHNDATYSYMYWYQQQRGQGLQLMFYSIVFNAPVFETGIQKERYAFERLSAQPEDTAVYFCAASQHSGPSSPRSLSKTASVLLGESVGN